MKLLTNLALSLPACLAAAALAPTPAAADADAIKRALDSTGYTVAWAWQGAEALREKGTMRAGGYPSDLDPAECDRAIAKARDAGARGSDRLASAGFKTHPGARPVSGSIAFTISLDEGASVCADYRATRNAVLPAKPLEEFIDRVNNFLPREFNQAEIEREAALADDRWSSQFQWGTRCEAAVAKAAADGTPRDLPILYKEAVRHTLADVSAKVCGRFVEWGKLLEVEVPKLRKGQSGAVRAVYEKVGMKGDRLKLFMENGKPEDSPWLAPGCQAFVTDARKLAKAKKLFQWSEGDAGIQVTKYVFKGNKYTWSTAVYPTQARAYKACK